MAARVERRPKAQAAAGSEALPGEGSGTGSGGCGSSGSEALPGAGAVAPAEAASASGKRRPGGAARQVKRGEITDADLIGYLNENRVGDAKLYCRLHRGTVVYVRYWERFLVWAGNHWQEDDYDLATQRIEGV